MACERAFGKGSVCFAPSESVRLAALLATLTELYIDRRACEPPPHDGTSDRNEGH